MDFQTILNCVCFSVCVIHDLHTCGNVCVCVCGGGVNCSFCFPYMFLLQADFLIISNVIFLWSVWDLFMSLN